MKSLVLVAYATRYGSTEETAHMVAAALHAQDLEVEVRAVDKVATLTPYSAIVLAAALYVGRLHGKARRFLQAHRDELTHIPVALLVPGPVGAEEKQWVGAREQLDKELARMTWLHPVARQIVGGKWDPAKLGFPFRWTMKNVPATDARDWTAIRSWAHELAAKLLPAETRV